MTGVKELITHSRKVAFRACQRRHHFAYEIGARPVRQHTALSVGNAMHAWLETWFESGQRWSAPDFWHLDPFEAARLRAMVLAYHRQWHDEPWTALAVEAQFRAPLTNPITGRTAQFYERAGKLDAVIEKAGGGPDWDGQWVVEHKSHGGPLDLEDTYWQRLRMDPQCSDYFVGARALGFEPRGIIYDVVCKPAIEPHTATPEVRRKMTLGMGCKACGGGRARQGTGHLEEVMESAIAGYSSPGHPVCEDCDGTGWKEPPRLQAGIRVRDETPGEFGQRCFALMTKEPHRYLHRRKVVRLEHEIHEHMLDDWHTVRTLHEQRASGVAPRNPDACFLNNRPCDYWAVCGRAASIDDPRLFQITGAHPELCVVNDW